jgi:hypothetical protein
LARRRRRSSRECFRNHRGEHKHKVMKRL